jgi:endonuclease/exonuclease/phosphatase (EEP) superfamily protein YafD
MSGVLRVISANLGAGRADSEAFAEQVLALRADVVCAQEIAPDQAEMLSQVLPHGRLEPREDCLGMGIALRASATVGRIPLRFRDARVAVLDPADWPDLSRPWEIVNVHMASPAMWPFHRQPAVRRDQLRGLLVHLDTAPARRRVVVGDFNASPVWPLYRRMARRLTDVARAHARARGERPRRTWPHRPRLFRIDHCFAEDLAAEDVEVLPVRGSDHHALRVDFALE